MRFFGFTITRENKSLAAPDNRGGWWPIIRESFAGAWQRNVEVKQADGVLAFIPNTSGRPRKPQFCSEGTLDGEPVRLMFVASDGPFVTFRYEARPT